MLHRGVPHLLVNAQNACAYSLGMAKSRVAGNLLDEVCDKLIMHRLGAAQQSAATSASSSSSSSAPSTPGASALSAAALAKQPTDIVPRYCIDRKYIEPRVYGMQGEWRVTRLTLPNTNPSYHRHMRMVRSRTSSSVKT